MAIVCCAIPDFPLALLARAEAAVWERPVALTDPDERVIAATPPAQAAGVSAGQSARQARLLCRELHLQAADLPAAEGEFAALLALLDDYSDAVEPFKLGSAYLTAPDLDERSAPGFCTALGSGIRRAFGQALQPAIGCDQGKFTASAAARRTRTGAVRVVLGAAEQPFLRPLPVGWLPLSAVHQRLLGYLGIDTLGQFADLPPPAVFQQFGAAVGHPATSQRLLCRSWFVGWLFLALRRELCLQQVCFGAIEGNPLLRTLVTQLLVMCIADAPHHLDGSNGCLLHRLPPPAASRSPTAYSLVPG